jgi:hypothetical protein
MKNSNIIDRQEIIAHLLTSQCRDNAKALQIADDLKTFLLISELHNADCFNKSDYIGSSEFQENCATIDAYKLKLIVGISKY